jgi:hypothetical protein
MPVRSFFTSSGVLFPLFMETPNLTVVCMTTVHLGLLGLTTGPWTLEDMSRATEYPYCSISHSSRASSAYYTVNA